MICQEEVDDFYRNAEDLLVLCHLPAFDSLQMNPVQNLPTTLPVYRLPESAKITTVGNSTAFAESS